MYYLIIKKEESKTDLIYLSDCIEDVNNKIRDYGNTNNYCVQKWDGIKFSCFCDRFNLKH